jgi:hypothetical protein
MTFSELLVEIQKLKREEHRLQTEDNLEVVIAKDCLEPVVKVLTEYFGPPLKPQGDAPSREAKERAAPHGGIRKEQTMFFRQGEGVSECALFWPWGSGTRVTVKIIQSKSSGADAGLFGALKGLFGSK